MFYKTDTNQHGLRHDPFKALIAPRPIGWIGSKGRDGSINLAPYSFFNAVHDKPKIIMFSSEGRKDSVRNAEETGVFTTSLVTIELAEAMNASSASVGYGTSEFAIAGLTPVPGQLVDAPYVGEALAAMECRVTEIIQPCDVEGRKLEGYMVFGQVVGIHIKDSIISDGLIDMSKAVSLARLGYNDYTAVEHVFSMRRPIVS